MKKLLRKLCPYIIVMLFLCVFLLFCQCRLKKTNYPAEEVSPPYTVRVGPTSEITTTNDPAVELGVNPQIYSTKNIDFISYTLKNNSNILYDYAAVAIEIWQDSAWHQLELRTDKIVVEDADAVSIPAGRTINGRMSFFRYGDVIPPGDYRLIVGLGERQNGPPVWTKYIAAEFEVVH